jgi:hypothetical protein
MNNEELYFTQSLNIAAFLKYKGFEVKKVLPNQGITTFYFERSDSVFDAIREYNNNSDLKRFINSFREIKEMIKR